MPTARARKVRIDPPRVPVWLVGRSYFGTTAFVAVCGAVLLWWPADPTSGARGGLTGAALAYSLVCLLALAASRSPRFPVNAGLFAVTATGILLCGAFDFEIGGGVRSPSFGLCAVAVCMICAIAGRRWGLCIGATALLQSAALVLAESRGFMASPVGATPVAVAFGYRAMAVGCSLLGGGLIARLIDHFLHTAAEREERFRGLLNIAADWYWEQDHLFRYSLISSSASSAIRTGPTSDAADPPVEWLRRTPWQIADTGLSERQLDALRADLESHLPFTGLLVQRRDASGRWRTESLSGAPQFGAGAVFRGYWGVARDVTDELAAERTVQASETRYRELFSRSPSPIFLHRHGLIFDANQAAARLFGFSSAAAMNGFDSIAFFVPGEAREQALRQLAALEALPAGEGMPVSDLQVRSVDGRSLSVHSTAVRIDTASGPAVLSIFFDITARQAVEGALRRSEAMLAHLFATSPDSITLCDNTSGRYTLVNPAFCRLTGFSAEQVVGRTMTELGLWHDPHDAERLAARLDQGGAVTDLPAVFVCRSGALVSVLLSVGRFVMDKRDYIVVNARDVTASERTRLEHAAILDRASIGIAFTRDRRFVQANPFFEAMFGWPRGGLIGQPGSAVWSSDAGARAGAGARADADPGAAAHGGVANGDAAIDELAEPLLSRGQPFAIERQMRRAGHAEAANGGAVDRFWCRLLAQAVDPADPSRGGTIWIAEDVTERRRLDLALASARDAAEAASIAKSAFLANTSHEIRTPLNGLLGLARLALQPDVPAQRRAEYLMQILDSAQGLADIMSDILDVSKIEAGKIALDCLPFALRDCIEAVHQAHRPLAESKGVELRLEIDRALPTTVWGDPARLRQILSNFIGNALKFTDHGQVVVRAEPLASGETRFAVSDTGPGIDAGVQARLFTPFSQGDASITRRYGGTGLGLVICREFARLMGGRVGLTSQEGVGSTFWAELPLSPTEATRKHESSEAEELARLVGKRVLMVEDNPVNMMIGVAMLEHWGIRVVQAGDGRLAIDAVHEAVRLGEPFDAVLMDLQMPVMGGHEASRELRRTFSSQTLPIIALTAAALAGEREEALSSGMDDFLTKPVDAARLRQVLARHLAG